MKGGVNMCQFCGQPIEPKGEDWDSEMWWDAVNGMETPDTEGEEW